MSKSLLLSQFDFYFSCWSKGLFFMEHQRHHVASLKNTFKTWTKQVLFGGFAQNWVYSEVVS